MAARAYWKGHLRMSLVSIPVEMYNAVETKNEISFRQIHKPVRPPRQLYQDRRRFR